MFMGLYRENANELQLINSALIQAEPIYDQIRAQIDAAKMKETNPKDAIAEGKLPLHLWPTTATALGAMGFLDGMLKYGRTNWRVAGVRTSVYIDAAMRHLMAYLEGEEVDPDSGVPHLGHALACIAIIVDAEANGKLNDDRAYNPKGGYRAMVNKLTPLVKLLKEKHKDKSPKHYTIQDASST
jgi:hypothetical protein